MRWYKNVASRGSVVHSVALLPISARKSCASSARGPSVSTATGKKHVARWETAVFGRLIDWFAIIIIIIIIVVIVILSDNPQFNAQVSASFSPHPCQRLLQDGVQLFSYLHVHWDAVYCCNCLPKWKGISEIFSYLRIAYFFASSNGRATYVVRQSTVPAYVLIALLVYLLFSVCFTAFELIFLFFYCFIVSTCVCHVAWWWHYEYRTTALRKVLRKYSY